MKINIENTPRSIADLFFNDGNTSGSGEFTCIGNNQRVNKIVIPIYQRDYDWEKEELLRLLINTSEYISILAPANLHNSYFVGTVLLEKQAGKEGIFELIDGQQRLTTAFLLNYVGYIIALERFYEIPNFNPKRYSAELTKRLLKIKSYEDKLFCNKENTSLPFDWNFIFTTEFLDTEDDESIEKSSFRLKFDNIQEYREPKIHHENTDQNNLFIDALKNTKLVNHNNHYSLTELPENDFNERANNIFDYLRDFLKSRNLNNDEFLGASLEYIDNFSAAISFCVLVSDNPDDSFKLFEVLNSTGRILTVIDKLKNHLYESIVNKNNSLKNNQFNAQWSEISEFQSNSKGSNITLDLVRSEAVLIKDKFYEYFSNKTIYLPNKTIVRDDLFKKENPLVFFNRITIVTKTLDSIYSIDAYNTSNTPHTLGWYYRVMNKFSYDWGRQVLFGTIILTNHLKKDFPIANNGYWSKPLIDSTSTLIKLDTTSKFIINISDILLKIGTIGIINGLSSKKLPAISQEILSKIINFVRTNKNEDDLGELFTEIKGLMNLFIIEQKVTFETHLRSLTYTKSAEKKYMTLLIYMLYNRGNAAHYIFERPSLEHFEPRTTQSGSKLYYSGADREELIHTMGNMILMNQKHNSILGNLPISEKLNKISTSFNHDTFFGTNIYRNLIPSANIHGNIAPYSNFPVINNTLAYNLNGAPNKELFKLRLDFYVSNLIDMICSGNQYILSGEDYEM